MEIETNFNSSRRLLCRSGQNGEGEEKEAFGGIAAAKKGGAISDAIEE